MSEENERERELEAQAPTPEVLTPRQRNMEKLAERFNQLIDQILGPAISGGPVTPMPMISFPRTEDYNDLPVEDKKVIDAFMEELKPEIQAKSVALMTEELKDRLARAGTAQIKKLTQHKKKASLKRKRGCLYLQFGTGEPDDPIDEFLVAST